MKQNIAGLAVLGLLTLWALASCASVPQVEPEWYQNTDAVYPQDLFIAYQGRGRTRAEAEKKALAGLAAYFEQEVRSEGTASVVMTEQRGAAGTAVEKTRRIEETITVTVSRNLSAVRYAEDAWKHLATGEYVTVAYINREEAWAVYLPQAQKAADTLSFLVYGAREDAAAGTFTRALRFCKAEAYASGEEFVPARSFAQGLHQTRAAALFDEADRLRAPLFREAAEARRNASVYLECPLDLEGVILSAAKAAFSAAGFPAADRREGAAAECVIRVNEGLLTRPGGTFYQPELSGEVKSRTGNRATVFSFAVQAGVQSAVDKTLARSRAYNALAQALRDRLPELLAE
ncbi:MAG: hypothetical protein LBJ86_05165 [Spirochaetaceae bacterium]|nr:hypothetical protein [Spirochaetaceae bacterium]